MLIRIAILYTVLLTIACLAESDNRSWVIIQAKSADERTAIANIGVCIEEILPTSIAGIADTNCLSQLTKSGFIIKQATPLANYTTLMPHTTYMRSTEQFSSFENMTTDIQHLAATHPDILTISSIGHSYENRNLLLVQCSIPYDAYKKKSGILFVGTHHAREHISTELCLKLISYLCEHKHEPSINALLASTNIYIIPMLNPDGVTYDYSKNNFACWRKNRRLNSNGSIGVDLNRNYSYMWNGKGNIQNQTSECYSGPQPFSEPETQAIKAFFELHKNISIFVSYHSYGNLILYPWGCKKDPIENIRDRTIHIKIAKKLAEITGYTAMPSSALYVAPGDATDWAYGIKNIISFTIELMPHHATGCTGFYPTDKQKINSDISKNIDAALYLCALSIDPYNQV